MATFVLVHGAWHGSWCWARVRHALAADGHQVFTPTLTGVGERSHLLSRDIDLQVHVDDVVNLLRWEELDDVILCGHSYGGCVISGAADAVPDQIAALAYLDAFLLEEGEGLHNLLPELFGYALDDLLTQGRLTTLDEWLMLAKQSRIKAAVIDLAHAELFLRREGL